jgi:CheY-like chemotaxis protein
MASGIGREGRKVAHMNERILVVEDEATTRSLIEYKLHNSGYQVHVVTDGTFALEYLRSNVPDMIILDLMMPLMSGTETLVELRKNERFRDTSYTETGLEGSADLIP